MGIALLPAFAPCSYFIAKYTYRWVANADLIDWLLTMLSIYQLRPAACRYSRQTSRGCEGIPPGHKRYKGEHLRCEQTWNVADSVSW